MSDPLIRPGWASAKRGRTFVGEDEMPIAMLLRDTLVSYGYDPLPGSISPGSLLQRVRSVPIRKPTPVGRRIYRSGS